MMRSIFLHGHLSERFGESFRLDVATPAEAVPALSIQVPGFRQAIAEGAYRVVRGNLHEDRDDNDLPETALRMRLGSADVHFVPVLHGGKKSGAGKIILGTVLIAATVITAGAAAPAAGAGAAGGAASGAGAGAAAAGTAAGAGMGAALPGFLGSSLGLTYSSVALFGTSLVLGGVAQMLAPSPSMDGQSFEPADQKPSFIFNGPANVAEQGNAIPLVYGRMRTGSVVISSGIEAVQI